MTEAERNKRSRIREKEFIRLREESKLKFREIGNRLGVSTQHARVIYMNGVRHRDRAPHADEIKASVKVEKQILRNLQVITHCFYSQWQKVPRGTPSADIME